MKFSTILLIAASVMLLAGIIVGYLFLNCEEAKYYIRKQGYKPVFSIDFIFSEKVEWLRLLSFSCGVATLCLILMAVIMKVFHIA